MYLWSLNNQQKRTEHWHGWALALIGAAMGGMLAGMWLMQNSIRARSPQRQQFDRGRLGQAPSRSHIQLETHPARQEQPR